MFQAYPSVGQLITLLWGKKPSEKHWGCSRGPDVASAWWLPIASESCRALWASPQFRYESPIGFLAQNLDHVSHVWVFLHMFTICFRFSVPYKIGNLPFKPFRSFQGSVGHIIGSLGGDRVTVLFEPAKQADEVRNSIPEYPASCLILWGWHLFWPLVFPRGRLNKDIRHCLALQNWSEVQIFGSHPIIMLSHLQAGFLSFKSLKWLRWVWTFEKLQLKDPWWVVSALLNECKHQCHWWWVARLSRRIHAMIEHFGKPNPQF